MSKSNTPKSDVLELDPKTDFTSSALVEYLNNTYTHKKTGLPFKSGDVQQYLRRGHLPKPYGHHPLEIIVNDEIGINVIRVHFDKKVKQDNIVKV